MKTSNPVIDGYEFIRTEDEDGRVEYRSDLPFPTITVYPPRQQFGESVDARVSMSSTSSEGLHQEALLAYKMLLDHALLDMAKLNA